MGWDIRIGALTRSARTRQLTGVRRQVLARAPAYGERLDRVNRRLPTAVAWHDLLQAAGLTDWWARHVDEQKAGDGHWQVTRLRIEDQLLIRAALENFQALHPQAEAGFMEDPGPNATLAQRRAYIAFPEENAQLARLIWLDFWVTWACQQTLAPGMAVCY